MTHTFKVTAADQPAVLERLLRVTRHRGYTLQSLSAEISEQVMVIRFSVDSQRPASQLYNQLQKLYDVINIEQQ